MFKGSLRFNLDPFDQYTDADLWRALDAAELRSRVEQLPRKLDADVVGSGGGIPAMADRSADDAAAAAYPGGGRQQF